MPRVLFASSLPLQVNANANTIRVETVLAYEEIQNGQPVLVAAPQPTTETWELERYEPFETQREFVLAVKVDIPANVTLPQTLNFTVNLADLKLFANTVSTATRSAPLDVQIFGSDRGSSDPKEFFTGRLVEATQTTPITASLTINTRPSPNELIRVPTLKIQPNVKEADAIGSTPKKLVPPGKTRR